MSLKRISFFIPSLEGGGTERSIVTIANSLAHRGFKVDLLLAHKTGCFVDFVSDDVRIIDLKAKRTAWCLLPLLLYLKRDRPEVMLSAMTHCNVISLLALKFAHVNVRIVVSERGLISGEYRVRSSISSWIVYKLVPLLYKSASAICAVSLGAAQDLSSFTKIPLFKINVLYNPFDLKSINLLSREALCHPWFAPGHPPVILAAGRLNEAKDFSTLLLAFKLVLKKRNARLVILGEGELLEHLQRMASELKLNHDVLALPGFVRNPYAWFSRCDVFVLSSRREGLPGVLIEAMACGAPVVSTDCPSGPSEILQDGKWGRLVPVGDFKSLAVAIDEVLSSSKHDLPNVLLRAEDFSLNNGINNYLKLLLPEFES